MDFIYIEINRSHERRGMRSDPHRCAVNLAIRDRFPGSMVIVGRRRCTVDGKIWIFRQSLCDQVYSFDKTGTVQLGRYEMVSG